jgi:hypothetical protein
MPGGITVTREAVHALDPVLEARITARVMNWRDSVPVGTATTVDKLINCSPDCGCPKGGGPEDTITAACTGNRGHGMALEVVMDILAPVGGVCEIPGIKVLRDRMPFWVVCTGC